MKAFRRRTREQQPAKRAQYARKRAKTAASIAFLMGSLLVLTAVLGWQLTAVSQERSVIATAGIAAAVAVTVVLAFGYALVFVHVLRTQGGRRSDRTVPGPRADRRRCGRCLCRAVHAASLRPSRTSPECYTTLLDSTRSPQCPTAADDFMMTYFPLIMAILVVIPLLITHIRVYSDHRSRPAREIPQEETA